MYDKSWFVVVVLVSKAGVLRRRISRGSNGGRPELVTIRRIGRGFWGRLRRGGEDNGKVEGF